MYADGPKRAVEADRYDHSFHSGTDLSALCVYFVHIVDLVGLELEPGGQERLDVKGVLGVRVGSVWVIGVLGDVVLVREERPHTTQLEDALSAVHDSQFILAHKLFATMSSGKFKKGQALSKKAVFHSACPFLIHVFCLALFETQNYNILDGGAKWII